MVAYSFKQQFVEPILSGRKRQTIRGYRKRHTRPNELMHLYTGMRTKYCSLIGTATCVSVNLITIHLDTADPHVKIETSDDGMMTLFPLALDKFAREDGFLHWPDMVRFWDANHPDLREFSGVLIRWTGFREGVHRV